MLRESPAGGDDTPQTAPPRWEVTTAVGLGSRSARQRDIWDRKRCFVFGLLIYGVGGLLVVIPRGSISPVWVFVAIGALIGLVLGVLIPRGSTEAGPPAPSSTAAAGEATR